MSNESWRAKKHAAPVRIQWDPERNMLLRPRAQRAIQIGLSQDAVTLFVNQWITHITHLTPLAHAVQALVQNQQFAAAQALLPKKVPYPVSGRLAEF